MTGPQHFAEADKLLTMEGCEYGCPHSGCRHERRLIERAQAHAVLALAAAQITPFALSAGMWDGERKEWLKAMTPP